MHGGVLLLRDVICGILIAAAPTNSAPLPIPPLHAIQAPKPGTLVIIAALVDQDMRVRPVPLHRFVLLSAASDTTLTRTSVEGRATLSLPPGSYTLNSLAPITFEGQEFRWSLPVAIEAGVTLELSLSNDNAITEPAAPRSAPPPSSERAETATTLFRRFSSSVFKVKAGLAHGTGFLADTLGGVILTNSHVVENAEPDNLTVELDPRTRVRAQLLARDPDADIAVLRVHPLFLRSRTRIPLQNPVGKSPVVPGERLMAMGYPLSQELTITSGIASSVRAGAIISDVNINPGNSGGPLLNVDGEAVAINTFGDVAARGAGVSGSILVARAGPALSRAVAELQRAQSIAADSLPVMPSWSCPVSVDG